MSILIHRKVGQLLEIYPEAESLLIEWVPAFKSLQDPVLRRTGGRIATLEQAARMAGVNVQDLVHWLRLALGQPANGTTRSV